MFKGCQLLPMGRADHKTEKGSRKMSKSYARPKGVYAQYGLMHDKLG